MRRSKVISAHVPGWLAKCVEEAADHQGYTVSQFIMKSLTEVVRDVLGKDYVTTIAREWRAMVGSKKKK